MALDTLELFQAIDLVKAEIRRLYPDANLADFTDWSREAEVLGRLFVGNQQQALYALRSRFARTCPDSELDNLAIALGTRRQAASKYTGKVIALSETAAAAVLIPAGTVLRASDGTEFITTSAATTAHTTYSPLLYVATGTSRTRVVVAPDETQLSVDEVIALESDFGSTTGYHGITDVLAGSSAIDIQPHARVDDLKGAGNQVVAAWGAVVEVEAVDAGGAGLRSPWEKLTWDPTTKPANLDDEAIVMLTSGGGDVESDDELRARLVALESAARGAGTTGDYMRWAMNTPDVRVGKAFIYPNLVAQGVITIVVLGVSGARELGSTAIAKVKDYVETQMPAAGVVLDVRSGSYLTECNVTVQVTTRTGGEPDWSGSFTIDTGSTTTRVELTTDPSSTIEIGDRVLVPIQIGNQKRTVQRTVTAVDATGIDLDTALDAAPISTDVVYPGGPIAQDVIDAIETLFDDLGPGTYSGGVEVRRDPSPSIGSPGSVRLARIIQTVMDVDAVENVSVTNLGGGVVDVFSSAMTVFRLGRLYVEQI